MTRPLAGLLLAAVVFAALPHTAAQAAPLRMGYSTRVGYGPLFLARDLGYLKDEGVEAELVLIEDPKVRFTALAAGQLDGLVSTVDPLVLYLRQGNEYQHVLALDDSAGGDGLVATTDVATTARNSVEIRGELGKLSTTVDPKATLSWSALPK